MTASDLSVRKQTGVTLVELMVAVAVIGITLGLAVPGFSTLVTGARLSSQANGIVADVRLARSEAASRGAWVVLCPSADNGASCSPSAADWGKGRIVFVDTDRSGVRASSEPVLKYTEPLAGGTTITASGFTDAKLTFSPYGGLLQGGMPGASGAYKLCAPSSASGKAVKVDTGGRPSAAKSSCP